MAPSCCQPDYDAAFDARAAHRQLSGYRRSGVTGTTRRLLDALKTEGVADSTVLDVGSGIGVIGLEMLAAGAAAVTNVDAAQAHVAVGSREVERRGLADRAKFHLGDFVALAGELEPADIVTLHRVVCCYGDWAALISSSANRSRRLLGLVYPNDRWWIRLAIRCGNLVLRLSGQSFRGFVHPERRIDEGVRAEGFDRRLHHRGWVWQTLVYERVTRHDAA
ncbi:MAG TPA: class I SAM-dependent methyltransferase [Candidatus Limnocylindrales bacterium]|nr:class I SAM-dependent methyltransferase [Candidatus Limnocylindrales bacterium]